MSEVEVVGLSKRYGATPVLNSVDFLAPAGTFVTLLGPSGCGKTTTLRCIAGFEDADGGDIRIGGANVRGVPPWKRGLGVVFQSYALFPFMTVSDNVAFGLKRQGMRGAAAGRRVAAALELVALSGLERRFPHQLSGGQQQRVALARALAIEPQVLLLDEPLSNLDAKLRAEMRFELKRIQRDAGVTTILVTHDQDEALTLSDHIVVMNGGRVLARGTPQDVWQSPRDAFVADFLGVENLLPLPAAGRAGAVTLGFRAADASMSRTGVPSDGAGTVYPGHVIDMVFRGTFFTCRIRSDDGVSLVAECPLGFAPTREERVWVRVPLERQLRLACTDFGSP